MNMTSGPYWLPYMPVLPISQPVNDAERQRSGELRREAQEQEYRKHRSYCRDENSRRYVVPIHYPSREYATKDSSDIDQDEREYRDGPRSAQTLRDGWQVNGRRKASKSLQKVLKL